MAYKNTYYEINELYPKILNTSTPVRGIARFFVYYILLLIYFIKTSIKLRRFFSLFKKKEISKGREFNTNMEYSPIKPERGLITKTDSTYYSLKDSENLIKELSKNQKINIKDFNKPFWIKKRVEYINKEGKDSIYIIINFPKFTKKILKLF